jgi:hypothetical protein
MNHSKVQFYSIWIIFGLVVYYSFRQIIGLLQELVINAGIILDVNPLILKYSVVGFYGITWITLLILSIKVIKQKKLVVDKINYKSLRKGFLLIIISGLISQIAEHFLFMNRPKILEEYLQKHEINYMDFYPDFYMWTVISYFLIFITLITVFYILTKRIEKGTNANKGYI